MTLAPGSTFGHFRIQGLLGQGAMGAVYLAEQASPQRLVALKVIAPELSESPEFRGRFRREANILALLEHQNIVPIWEAGEAEGQLYLSSRYVRGGTLRDLLGRPLPTAEVARSLASVAAALDYAHGKGVIHRDVKPSNILLTEPDAQGVRTPIIADFGIARMLAEGGDPTTQVTMPGQALGTIAYMSPEQLAGQQADARSDQYALAVIAYQMLTGAVPFAGTLSEVAAQIAVTQPRPPSMVSPGLPRAVDRVIATALSKRPEARYPSCTAFIAALQQAAGPAVPAERRGLSGRALAIAGAGVLALAAVVGVIVWRLQDNGPDIRTVALATARASATSNGGVVSATANASTAAPTVRPTATATGSAGVPSPTVTVAPTPPPTRPPTPPPTASRTPTPTPAPTAAPGPATTGLLSPSDLLTALRASNLNGVMARGFSADGGQSTTPTSQASSDNATGAVDFTVHSKDDASFIDYVVFGNRNDANAYLKDVSDTTDPAVGISLPSGCAESSDTLNGKSIGWTLCYIQVGNVVVRVGSGVYGTQGHGTGDNADTLAQRGVVNYLLTVMAQTTIGSSEFPLALAATTPARSDPTSAAQQRNALGGLHLVLRGGDRTDEVDYFFFPTDADASGYVRDRGQSTDANLGSLGLTYTCVSFAADDPNVGQSDCYVQVGNVVARGVTQVSGNTKQGNPTQAGALATAAVRHLQLVQNGR